LKRNNYSTKDIKIYSRLEQSNYKKPTQDLSRIYGGGAKQIPTSNRKINPKASNPRIPTLNLKEIQHFWPTSITLGDENSPKNISVQKMFEDKSTGSFLTFQEQLSQLQQSQNLNRNRPTTSHKKISSHLRKDRIMHQESKNTKNDFTLNTGNLNLETINFNPEDSDSSFNLVCEKAWAEHMGSRENSQQKVLNDPGSKEKRTRKNPFLKSKNKTLTKYNANVSDESESSDDVTLPKIFSNAIGFFQYDQAFKTSQKNFK